MIPSLLDIFDVELYSQLSHSEFYTGLTIAYLSKFLCPTLQTQSVVPCRDSFKDEPHHSQTRMILHVNARDPTPKENNTCQQILFIIV